MYVTNNEVKKAGSIMHVSASIMVGFLLSIMTHPAYAVWYAFGAYWGIKVFAYRKEVKENVSRRSRISAKRSKPRVKRITEQPLRLEHVPAVKNETVAEQAPVITPKKRDNTRQRKLKAPLNRTEPLPF